MRHLARCLVVISLSLMLNVPVLFAEEFHVPEDFETIQEAIDESQNGDVIIVHPGTYVERLNPDGKAITIGSLYLTTGDPAYIDSTIVDGDGGGSVVTIRNGEDEGTILTGLTIRNGSADYGGGFYINNTTPTLDHLLIMNNHAVRWGAGIYCTADARPTLINLTVAGNTSDIGNGGIHVFNGGSAAIVNSIFWNNTPAGRPNGMTVTFTDIQGGYAGAGNLNTDPLFEDPDNDLYRLTEDSPCIDAGDPDFDDDPDETRADMGAFYYDQPFEPDIFVSPAVLDFGDVELELSADLILTVSNVGRTDLTISDVRIDNEVFTCDIENEVVIQPDDSLEITVTFTPEDLDLYQGTITITSDDPDEDEQEIAIPMTGTGVEPRDHVINVPEDYETIQEAIDNALDTDTVLVQPGTYVENIDFSGKNIVVGSLFLTGGEFEHIENTIIDGDANNTSIVLLANGETEDAVLIGFTLTNGTADFGAGIQCNGTDPTLDHLLIYGNSAQRWGGGIIVYNGANPTLTNLTVYGNDAGTNNGGLSVFGGAVATIVNSIFWANEPPAIPADQTITFSDIQGGYAGNGNINQDPQFADVDNADFHLIWGSPCIDSGDPNVVNDPDDTRADMGAFYFHQAEEPRIVVTPRPLNFGEVIVDQGANLILTISNVGRAALTVSNVSIAGDENFLSDFDDDLVIDQGDNRQLTVTFTPDAAADFNAVMTIFSDDPDNGELTVDMIGTGVEPIPEIRVNPVALDFGAVVVDRSLDLILTIGNTGHGDLTVLDISIDDNVFTSDYDGEFILAPQDMYQLTVTFTPDDIGDFAGVLTIFSNDPANGELTVDLTGRGRDFLINVPDDYQTIGEAIDAAFDGDTVLVQEGVYTEIVNFSGKNIVVGSMFIMDGDTAHISETIIDGDQNGRSVIVIRSGETADAVLSGFTIRNADTDFGGGIYLNNSAPTLDHLIITGNHCSGRGGGIYATAGSDPTISYVTIYGNVADDNNGGMGTGGGATVTVVNSIIYGNQPVPNSAGMTITYTDVEGGYAGEGNIDSDPLFTDADGGDLSLTADSPCIDTGSPDSPDDPDRTRADMGALYFHQDIEDAPRIEVSPDTLDFGEVVAGQEAELILTISNTGNLDLNVTDITVVGQTFLSDFGDAIVIEPDGSYEQTVTFAPEEIEDFEGSLTIESNDPNNGELIVPLFGSGSSTIREVGVYDTPGSAEGVFVAGGYAYVADYWRGLRIVNVSDPSNPVESSSYDTPGEAYTLYVVRNYCYLADGGSGLQIIDISDPQNPDLISTVDTPGEAFGVFISNGTAYVADLTGGLRIIDVSDPDNPAELGWVDTPSRAYGVYVSGDYAYIADQDGGLRVIDVSNPENPEEIGSFETEGRTYAVYGVGDFVYLANAANGMRLIDVSDPDNPQETGFLDTPGSAEGIFVIGDYAYVADGEEGLRVIDITNPDELEEVAFRDTPDYCIGVYVSGSYAYIADEGSGLHIFDISFFVPPAPDIAVEPDALDFGSILVDQTVDLTLTISNFGDTDLEVSAFETEGDYFSAPHDDAIIVLEPLSSFDLTVTFAPEEEGDFEGTLTIFSDDPDEGEFAVPLRGVCFEPGRVLNVPDDYGAIQAAIDASVDTDTVLVQPGVYTENLNFNGKNIVVGSLFMTTGEFEHIESTIIDGDANGRSVVVMRNGETNAAKLCGFTLRNSDTDFGGGLYINAADPTCDHLIIHSNATSSRGAGIYITAGSSPVISHVTVSGNVAEQGIGGLDGFGGSVATIVNSIFYGNTPAGMPADQVITFSDVEDGYAGEGNIEADPLFADSDNDDYNLTQNSPCINAGDPDAPEDPDETRADMGALFFLQEAVPDIVIEPDTLNFGEVRVGDSPLMQVIISNVGRADLAITGITVVGESFRALGDDEFILQPDESSECMVAFTPLDAGNFEGTLTIASNDPDEAEFTVYMFGVGVAPIITVDPEALDFGEVVSNQTARLTLTISNVGNAELRVTSFETEGDYFSAPYDDEIITLEPEDSYELDVFFTPPDEGEFQGILTIHCNDPEHRSVGVLLTGIGREPQIPEVGHLDGNHISDVDVVGNYAFVTDAGIGLRIIDVTDPANPEEVSTSEIDASIIGVEVNGDYAYVANSTGAGRGGLWIIDISDVENPEEVGIYGNITVYDVTVVADLAYLAAYEDGLIIIDVSDPENPEEVGSCDTPDGAEGVCVDGNYAYIADSRTLQVFDISNPRDPEQIGEVELPGDARYVTTDEDYAYVAAQEGGLRIIDISPPQNPGEIASLNLRTTFAVVLVNNIAFVGNGSNGFSVVDVSDPENPEEISRRDWDAEAGKLDISGNYAYIADGTNGLVILDVSDFVQYPDIEVSADAIDFEEVRLGTSVDIPLTISNEGNWDLTVSNVTIEGDYFTSDFDDAVVIQPDGSIELSVNFAPEEMGDLEAALTIFSDDLNNPELIVDLFGIGVNNPPEAVNPIEDIVIDEDYGLLEIADLNDVFDDPNGDEMTFTVDGPVELNLNITDDNILTLRPDDDFHADNLEVTVTADDGHDVGRLVAVRDASDRSLRRVARLARKSGFKSTQLAGQVYPNQDPRRDATGIDLFLVTVNSINDLPVIVDGNGEPMPDEIDVQIEEEERFRIIFRAVDVEDEGDALVWSMPDPENQLPDDGWEFIDHEDGSAHFTFTPNPDDAGDYYPVFVVSDSENGNDEITLNITVTDINQPPIPVKPIEDIVIPEDSGLLEIADLDTVFEDPDGDELTFRIVEGIDEFNLIHDDETNILTLEPAANYVGQSNVIIEADDGIDNVRLVMSGIRRDIRQVRTVGNNPEPRRDATGTDEFTVTVTPVNDPPVIVDDNSEPMPDEIDEQIQEEERFRITFRAVDVEDEGDALVWSMPDPQNQLPDDGWEFIDHEDGSAHFTFTPDFDDAGDYHPVFVVSDPEEDTDEITLNITVTNVNRPPILVREIPDQEFDEDDDERLVAVLTDNFVDPDGDELTFNDPVADGLDIRRDGANLYITPDADWNGRVDVTVRASDEESSTEDVFTVTVHPVNDPPIVVQPVDDIAVDEDPGLVEIADLDDVFEDPEGDEMNYEIIQAPEQLNMDKDEDNLLFFNPVLNYNSPEGDEIIIRATDDPGAWTETSFMIVINPVNDPPDTTAGIPNVRIDEDPDPRRIDLADLDEIFYDPDNDPLTYDVTSALRELNMDIDERWNILFFAPDENFHISEGTDIIITAEDDSLSTFDLHFRVVIDSVNDLPTDFELLTPADGAYVSSSPSVLFAWEESTDEADHSTVTYALVLNFNDEEHWFRDIEETRIFVAREDLSVEVNDTTDIEWWVYAYDGIDSLRCDTTFWLLVAPLSVNGGNEIALPTELTLGPVYPNPFNASTTIKYGLPQETDVLLAVYDIYGRRAVTLIDGSQHAGFHSVVLGSENLVSGMYIVRIVTGNGILTRKVILVR